MKNSTKDKIEGTVHELNGALKEKAGDLARDPNLQDEGASERIGGKIQKKVGDLEKLIGA
jgi:uncharacterized protein YjbJ (UPF0337 family)